MFNCIDNHTGHLAQARHPEASSLKTTTTEKTERLGIEARATIITVGGTAPGHHEGARALAKRTHRSQLEPSNIFLLFYRVVHSPVLSPLLYHPCHMLS